MTGTPGYLTVGGNAENEAGLLTEVHRLLGQGDVTRAQTSLLRAEPGNGAGVAFALAQTYDPNYLRSLPNANSTPNPSEAARWYRKWYEARGAERPQNRMPASCNASSTQCKSAKFF